MTKKLFNYIIISVGLYVKEEDVLYAAGAEWTISKATAIGEAPQIQLSGNDVAWDWFDVKDPATGEAYDLTGDSISIAVDATVAETLQFCKKLFVKGINVTATKVTYTA